MARISIVTPVICFLCIACFTSRTPAAEPRQVALVNEQPVFAYEVEHMLARTIGKREVSESVRTALREKAIEQLVDQRLIVEFAKQRKLVATSQFQLAWKKVVDELAAKGSTPEEYLERSQRAEAELQHAIWYELAWNALLSHYLTEANLKKHFQRQRRQFDGTRLKLAQIFFPLAADATAADVESTRDYAAQIREQIERKQLTFKAAAKQYSQAPSAKNGGEIGWIERHKPMPEEFSQAAFALQADDVSGPLVTSKGVHLIKLLEVKVGTREWHEVRPALEQAVQQYLFRWTADKQRPDSTIELTTAADS